MVSSDEAALGGYTRDGTVDLRGNPVLRSKRGSWKACSFVVGNLCMPISLSHCSFVVGNLCAYIADAHLGRYWTFIISSAIYLLGMCILTLAVSIPSLKPPPCGAGTADPKCVGKASHLQLGVFFLGLYTIALGTGGTKPNISTIGADQFDVFDPKERAHKLSFFNWWMFSIFFGTLFANTILVYVQDNVGWTIGYALPTLGLAISVVIFVVSFPFDPKDLYELGREEYQQQGKFPIDYTPSLSFLSSFLLKTTEKVTMRDGGRRGWILNNLNKSHLDYYYAFFAVLNVLNFVFFLVVSRLYVYRSEVLDGGDVKENNAANNGNGDVAK